MRRKELLIRRISQEISRITSKIVIEALPQNQHCHDLIATFVVIFTLSYAFFPFAHKIPSTLAILGWRGWIEAGHSRELKSFSSSGSTNFLLMENFQIHPSHTQCQQGSVRTCLTSPAENSARQSCKIFNSRSL